jgi:hypothetical protein
MTSNTLAAALSGGGRFAKWTTVGDAYAGTVTGVEVRQSRKFGTDTPDTWDDGSPKLQVAVTVATDDRADADDDGQRVIVVNLWGSQRRALMAACKAAGVTEPEAGQRFTAKWVSGAGGASDPRVYEYGITPAPSVVANVLAAAETAKEVMAAPTPAVPAGDDPVALAKSLLREGVPAADVAAATGLPEAVINALPKF